jgi:hypothetical protein
MPDSGFSFPANPRSGSSFNRCISTRLIISNHIALRFTISFFEISKTIFISHAYRRFLVLTPRRSLNFALHARLPKEKRGFSDRSNPSITLAFEIFDFLSTISQDDEPGADDRVSCRFRRAPQAHHRPRKVTAKERVVSDPQPHLLAA